MDCCCASSKISFARRVPGQRYGGSHGETVRIYDAVSAATDHCCQLFLSPNAKAMTIEEKDELRQLCEMEDKTFYIHCPFATNLASTAPLSSYVVSEHLKAVEGLPAACVLHIGKSGTIEQVSQSINNLQSQGYLTRGRHDRIPYHLLLEVAAGQKNELGYSWEDIRHLYEGLDYTRVGFCLDTQHAFAAGMSDFGTHEAVIKVLEEAMSISTGGISLIHLNDSNTEYGRRVDRHAPLRAGYIWRETDEGLQALVEYSGKAGIDLISETSDPLGDQQIVQSYWNP
jgi:endonuclease IV